MSTNSNQSKKESPAILQARAEMIRGLSAREGRLPRKRAKLFLANAKTTEERRMWGELAH